MKDVVIQRLRYPRRGTVSVYGSLNRSTMREGVVGMFLYCVHMFCSRYEEVTD